MPKSNILRIPGGGPQESQKEPQPRNRTQNYKTPTKLNKKFKMPGEPGKPIEQVNL